MNLPARKEDKTPQQYPPNYLPTSYQEITPRARENGLINSYHDGNPERITRIHGLGRAQKELLEVLIADKPIPSHLDLFNKKVTAAVEWFKSTALTEKLKEYVIETIITDDNPWMHDNVVGNIIKQIIHREIIPGEVLEVNHIDYHDRHIGVTMGGVQRYAVPNNPYTVYQHILSLKQFNDVEKKILMAYLDRMPYRKNYSLLTNNPESISDVDFDRKKGTVAFITGDDIWDSFRRYHFLHMMFDRDQIDDIADLSKSERAEKIQATDRYKHFSPDFLK